MRKTSLYLILNTKHENKNKNTKYARQKCKKKFILCNI